MPATKISIQPHCHLHIFHQKTLWHMTQNSPVRSAKKTGQPGMSWDIWPDLFQERIADEDHKS